MATRKVLILLFFFVLTACSRFRTGIPPILSENLCSPPCWHGIIPGETSHAEVLEMLPAIPYVQPNTLAETTGRSILDLQDRSGANALFIYYDPYEIVRVLVISFDSRFSFRDVLSFYGEPENYLAIHRMQLTTYLIYPESGTSILSIKYADKNQPIISESDRTRYVFFFTPELLEEVFTSPPQGRLTPDQFHTGLKDWAGFGAVETIDPDN
jgi:hypothetical protein